MQLSEAKAEGAAARYEELMQAGRAYFATAHPSKELQEALNHSVNEITQLTCNLIARYVLYSNATKSKRLRRLSTMGFDASGAIWSFGADQWVTTIFAVIVLSAGMMAFMPGMLRFTGGEILMISIPFGLSIGAAVIAAVWVGQRSLHRDRLAALLRDFSDHAIRAFFARCVVHNHRRAFGRQLFRDLRANSLGRACHHRDLSFEFLCHVSPLVTFR